MSNLFKLSNRYNNFLILARIDSLEQIKEVYQAAKDLFSVKNMWLNSVEYEPMVESPLENILETAKKYYWNAKNYGLSASNHAKYLNTLSEEKDELESAKLIRPLDPIASTKLAKFKSTLDNMIPDIIAPPIAEVPKEEFIPTDFQDPESPDFYLKNPISSI